MTMKKEGRLALVCCLVFLCTCVKATEELEMAWMKKVSLQNANIAAVVGDVSGCTFVTGDTSENFGPGYPNLGRRDAYLSKYNPDGELVWVYPLGTEDFDSGSCLTVDAEGNCFVGGQTYGSLAENLIEDTGDTRPDAFVAKISSEGTCVWVRQFGGAQSDGACRVRLDRNGNCYVVGNTICTIISDVSNDRGVTIEEVMSECPFVAKFDPNGQLVWFNQVSESYANTGLGVGVDPNGTTIALKRATQLIAEIGGGKCVKGIVDEYIRATPSKTDGQLISFGGTGLITKLYRNGVELTTANTPLLFTRGDALKVEVFYHYKFLLLPGLAQSLFPTLWLKGETIMRAE